MSAASPLDSLAGHQQAASLFDAFRDNGGPVLYTSMNRTPAIEDIRNIIIYVTFSTLFVAFLIIFPGIRKERFSTFICVTISLFVGSVILISNYGTSWHVAGGQIASPYRAFSREKIFADVGVHIGLDSVNITLKALPVHRDYKQINYNERFYWIGPMQMKRELQRALAKGLPFPILTVAEYLAQDGEGFSWGRSYRTAGYYTSITLWVAFASWILMNILLCAVPRYGCYTMQLTGALLLLSNVLYSLLIPSKPLRIPFEGATLTFQYGWCYWLVFSAGITALVIGLTVSIVDILFPHKFSTILEVDYDTPYRYFVGNDVSIIGSLPPPMIGPYYYHHPGQPNNQDKGDGGGDLAKKKPVSNASLSVSKPHYLASNTTSLATESTLFVSSTGQHRRASSQKSSFSILTRDDINLELPPDELSSDANNNQNGESFVTTVEIEPQRTMGVDNQAYQDHEGGQREGSAKPETMLDSGLRATPSKSSRSSSSSSYYEGYSEDDLSDVSTTIIDGKRAISLSNFGKYAAQQQKRYSNGSNRGPTYGYQLASAGFRAHKIMASKRALNGRKSTVVGETGGRRASSKSPTPLHNVQSTPAQTAHKSTSLSSTVSASSSASSGTGSASSTPTPTPPPPPPAGAAMKATKHKNSKVDLTSDAAMW